MNTIWIIFMAMMEMCSKYSIILKKMLHFQPTYDLDPDLNFDNDYVPNQNLNCKYFAEKSFSFTYDQMCCKNGTCPVSLCHINIRSAPKNLKHFEYFLAGLQHEFTFIGLTETSLTSCNEDLYSIKGYNNFGIYRQHRKGGGIALHIKNI